MDNEYLVWSNEHRAWWKPGAMGYTVHLKSAGLYTRAEAINYSRARDQRPGEIMPEIPVRLADVLEAAMEPQCR